MSFKDHPVIISAGVFVASSFFWSFVYLDIILPNRTAKIELEKSQIHLLNDKELDEVQNKLYNSEQKIKNLIRENKKINNNIKIVEADVIAANSQIERLLKENFKLKHVNLFSNSDPYPIGFDKVRVGEDFDKVITNYDFLNLELDNDSLSGSVDNQWFDDISFVKNDANKLAMIVFSFRSSKKTDIGWMRELLVKNFGEPRKQDKVCEFWQFKSNDRIFIYQKLRVMWILKNNSPKIC